MNASENSSENSSETVHRSLEAKLDATSEKIDQLAARAGRGADENREHLRAQVDVLRTRLAEDKARRQAKAEADDKASDAGLVVLGREIDALYDDVAHGIK